MVLVFDKHLSNPRCANHIFGGQGEGIFFTGRFCWGFIVSSMGIGGDLKIEVVGRWTGVDVEEED